MTSKASKASAVMTLLTSVKAINTEIERVQRVGATYQVDLHVLACSVLRHVGKHGNIGIVNQFLAALPDAVRVNALKNWFEAFSKVTWIGADTKVMKTPAYMSAKPQRLGDAMEKPFWKFKANEGAPYVPLIMDTYIDQQIKRLEKDDRETKSSNWSAVIKALKAQKLAQPVLPIQ